MNLHLAAVTEITAHNGDLFIEVDPRRHRVLITAMAQNKFVTVDMSAHLCDTIRELCRVGEPVDTEWLNDEPDGSLRGNSILIEPTPSGDTVVSVTASTVYNHQQRLVILTPAQTHQFGAGLATATGTVTAAR